MNDVTAEQTERKALLVSAIGALCLAGLGIGFALLTESDAILLDGVFSGIGFFMAILTMKVSKLVRQPDDEHFQFGFAHFAPLLNVIKSLLMVTLCSFALVSAISALFTGGRSMNVGPAVIYGLIASGIGVVLALYLRRASRKTRSPLVALDAEGALIDMAMSAAVLLSFVGGWFLADSDWSQYVDYLDPAVVTLLCLVSLPVPAKILYQNGREVLLAAPDRGLQGQVREKLYVAFEGFEFEDYRIRMVKLGDVISVVVHAKPATGHPQPTLEQLDAMRLAFRQSIQDLGLRGSADVILVGDMALAD